MPLPEIPDHFYVQAIFSRSNGDDVVNTFCFRNHRDVVGESHTDPALLESLRDVLDSFYGTTGTTAAGVGRYLQMQLFGLRYVVYDLGQPLAGGAEIASATFSNSPGSTNNLPADVALVITWRTMLRGRSYRGRTYLGPLVEAAMDSSGNPASAFITRISEVAPLLIGADGTRDWQISVLSRTVPTATPVVRADVDHEFDTQRRRGASGAARTLIPAP